MAGRIPRFAVALEYDGDRAPVITASGQDEIAQRILELAQQSGVPIHRDNELALVLNQLDLGDHIPEALYAVIAEILCFAYQLSGKHKAFMDDIEAVAGDGAGRGPDGGNQA